jgi:hypothetical protein
MLVYQSVNITNSLNFTPHVELHLCVAQQLHHLLLSSKCSLDAATNL